MTYWSGKKVLVTGGAGFIGSYLVEELVADGAEVTVVDNLDTGRIENLSTVRGSIRFIEADLTDKCVAEEVTTGVEIVMNLAGKAYGFEYSMMHHGEMLTSNALINLNVLEAARRNGIERFLVVSSSCIYPDNAVVPTPDLDTFEGLPESVNEGYGWAKRIAELQARYYAREYNMQVAIVRPFNPYGGRYRWQGDKSHVIPALVKKVMDGNNPVVVWGSGNQRRNFVHVRDVAIGMKLVLQHYACADPVNLAFEETISLRDLIYKIIDLSGRKNVEVVFDTSKPEGRPIKSADSSKLRRVVPGFSPRILLEEGLEEMIQWYYSTFGTGTHGV